MHVVLVVGYANPHPIDLCMFIRLAVVFDAGNMVFGSLAPRSVVTRRNLLR